MSLSTISFWDDSKVCGTKSCNKTTGAYSGIPGDDMHEAHLKGKRNARAAQIGRKPHAAAMEAQVTLAPA
ncbi:prephenate dehydrogenase [Paraburkholderia metrosideri]|uniref:Prephenate dehydrogenase n=1 Tax=Paraburkholderia metrosideri TaxID=580937 RepID=A0ABW9DUB4_9BURK